MSRAIRSFALGAAASLPWNEVGPGTSLNQPALHEPLRERELHVVPTVPQARAASFPGRVSHEGDRTSEPRQLSPCFISGTGGASGLSLFVLATLLT